jgi:hypothetical protein
MRRWFAVSAVFILTWLAVAALVSVSHLPSDALAPGALSEDKTDSASSGSAQQGHDLGRSSTFARTRARYRGAAPGEKSSNPRALELLEELRKAPENGLLEHDIPSQLTVFQEQEVYVRLSRGPAAETFLQSLTDKTSEIVSVQDFVSLSLYGGKNFDIERLSPDPQSMRQNNYCLWKFHVTPKRGGKHTLKIQVNLFDRYGYVPVASYDREVEVNVPFPSRVALMWEDYRGGWVLTFLVLPLAASTLTAWMTARMYVQLDAKNLEGEKPGHKGRPSAKRKAGSRLGTKERLPLKRPAPASKSGSRRKSAK